MSIRRNTIFNLAGSVLPLVISLATVPFYLKLIGDVRYGILAIVWMLLDYFGFFDLGIGKATANQMARLGESPASERKTVFWTGVAVNAVLGIVGGLVLWGGGDYLLGGYFAAKVSASMHEELRSALPWLALSIPVATISAVCIASLEARERFLSLNRLQVSGAALYQLLPLGIAWWQGPTLNLLIAAAVSARIATSLPLFLSCCRHVPLQGFPRFSSALLKPLFSYGGWVTLTALVSPLLISLDRFLIGSQLGLAAVTHYTVPFTLVNKFQIIPASLSRTLFPRFSQMSWDESARMAHESVLGLVTVITPLIVAGIVLMKPFLTLWIGADLAELSAPVGEVLLVGVWINSLAFVPFGMLQAQQRPDVVGKFHVLELIPYIAALWAGLSFFGVQGAAWVWVMRVTVDAILLFSAVGLGRRIARDIWFGFLMLMVLQMGIHALADGVSLRAGVGAAVSLVALYWSARVAPASFRGFLASARSAP